VALNTDGEEKVTAEAMDRNPTDFCDDEGARRLKQRIEDYWRERGCAVDVKLVEARFAAAMRSARTDVRSDMLDGLPSREANPTGCGLLSSMARV
jgi:hypothetical protein